MPLKGRLALVGAASLAACCAGSVTPALAHNHDKPATKARFLHAVPGAAPAVLVVHGHPPRLESAYGKPSSYHACKPGPAKLDLRVEGQKKPVATAKLDIGRGAYTVIAAPDGDKVTLRAYKDDGVAPGKARLRTIHAAGELMGADVRVDGQAIARVDPGEASRYASVPPGRHQVSVTRPGGEGGALATAQGVPLTAGTTSTAILVGSKGEPTDVLVVADQAAGPELAPATGFVGDLGVNPGWLAVLAAALISGSLGGFAYVGIALRRASPVTVAPSIPEPAPPAPAPYMPPAPAEPPPVPPVDRALAVLLGAALTGVASLLYRIRRHGR